MLFVSKHIIPDTKHWILSIRDGRFYDLELFLRYASHICMHANKIHIVSPSCLPARMFVLFNHLIDMNQTWRSDSLGLTDPAVSSLPKTLLPVQILLPQAPWFHFRLQLDFFFAYQLT